MNIPHTSVRKKKEPAQISLHNKKIGTCMTHRAGIVWIDIASPHRDIVQKITEYPMFDCFPVCAGTIDVVLGILAVKDFLLALLENPSVNLQKILTKPLFIPESVSTVQSLQLFKAHDACSACIIDEYGGIEGFITKNALITALLDGSLHVLTNGEHGITRQNDGSVTVSGQISIDELQSLNLFEDIVRKKHEEYYTLAGYLLTFTDAIPCQGDVIDTGSYLCQITAMHGQRIERVSVIKKDTTL